MGVASFPPLEGSAGGPPSTVNAAVAGNPNVYQTQRVNYFINWWHLWTFAYSFLLVSTQDLNYTDQAGGGLYLPHGSAAGNSLSLFL